MHTSIVTLTAGLAAMVSAFDCNGPYFSFYNRAGNSMSYQRIDPALNPGTESPHLHSFDGGNGLSASMGFADTQGSTCTSARIKPDKSLYWRPTLYWNGNNTGFYRVPDKFLKIYYKFGDSGNVRANVTEFPENFKMIAGSPNKRSDDGNNPGGIKWSCKGENYASIDAVGFPKGFTSCKEGLATEITFPSCWNGNDIDPKKPNDHMRWPTGSGTGLDACPAGFKVARFPSIFIEFWYDVSAFDGHYSANDVPWVLSNGDPTGYSFHADFLNGWEKGVLAKATAENGYCNCGCGCGTDQMKTCFGADNVNDDGDAEFKTCAAATETYGGDDSSPLDKLPGCNPIQSGPADATSVTGEGCAATPTGTPYGGKSSVSVSSVAQTVAPSVPKSSGGYSHATSTSELNSATITLTSAAADTSAYATPSKVTTLGISGAGGSLGLYFSDLGTVPGGLPGPSGSDDVTGILIEPTAPASIQEPSISLTTTASPIESTPKPVKSTASLVESTVSPVKSTVSPVESTASTSSEDCTTPVSITITPTVYVTVTASTTSCNETSYKTVTNTATVTVPAGGYKHKRHVHRRAHKH